VVAFVEQAVRKITGSERSNRSLQTLEAGHGIDHSPEFERRRIFAKIKHQSSLI